MPAGRPQDYAQDDLLAMYGVRDPVAEQARHESMTHPPAALDQGPGPMAQALDRQGYEQAQQAHEQLRGMGFEDEPMPPAEAMFGAADARASEADQYRAAAGQRVQWSAPNPVYEPTRRYTGAMLGDEGEPGLLDQYESEQERVHDARLRRERAAAEYMEIKERELDRLRIDQDVAEHERQRQLDEQFANQKAAMDAYEETATKVREAQALDPDAWWKNKSTGGKILAVIGLALGGFAGGWVGRPEFGMQLREQMMKPEIEKQKEAYNRLKEGLGTAEDRIDHENSLYGQVMARVQDERQADLIVESTMLEAMLAEGERMLAEAGVQVLNAEQELVMNNLRQQVAEKRMQLEATSATTPKKITGSAYARPKEERDALNRAADRAERREKGLEDVGLGVIRSEAIDIPKEERGRQHDAAKAREQSRIRAEEGRITTAMEGLAEREAARDTAQSLLELPDLARGVIDKRTAEGKRISDALRRLPGFLADKEDPADITWDSDARARLRQYIEEQQGEIDSRRRFLGEEQHQRYLGREKTISPTRVGGGEPASLRRQ